MVVVVVCNNYLQSSP